MNIRFTLYLALLAIAVAATCIIPVATPAQDAESDIAALAEQIMPWAYPLTLPGPAAPKDDGLPRHVPGSTVALTLTQIADGFNVPDWHPDDHPAMPEVVAHGRKPAVRGCGYCHLPNGQGRPENAGVAGLPAAYIVQQIADFKNGVRTSTKPKIGRLRSANMIEISKDATDAEVNSAAEYFSSLKFKLWIRVVESNTVPKTRPESMLVPLEGGGTEPIGERIIEMPENLELTQLRDSASGFVAYVPVGSIKKGEMLVKTGGDGRTIPCGTCHGEDLKGQGAVPPLAGRSPSSIVRQLYDFRTGARSGPQSPLMKGAVAKLTAGDMVAIAAYLSSRTP